MIRYITSGLVKPLTTSCTSSLLNSTRGSGSLYLLYSRHTFSTTNTTNTTIYSSSISTSSKANHDHHHSILSSFPSENLNTPNNHHQKQRKDKPNTINSHINNNNSSLPHLSTTIKKFDIKLNNVNYSVDLTLDSSVETIISKVWQTKAEAKSQPIQMKRNPLFNSESSMAREEKKSMDKDSFILVIDGKAYSSLSSYPLLNCKENSTIRLELRSEYTHPYARTLTFSKVGDELFKLFIKKENPIHKSTYESITESDIRKYITKFENELAICQPQVLRDILNDRKLLNKVFYSMLEFIDQQIEIDKRKKENPNENNNGKIDQDNRLSDDKMKTLTDLKHPHNWFPQARRMKRKFILHIGPTNSGKTHNALKRLKEAESGIFCGPLRMLAHQVYEKLNDENIPCNLTTGQQIIQTPGANHTAYTVEMASVTQMVQVAVIDEFQMLSDLKRGFAWTRAILGIPAEEIHLCGDNTSVELVKRMLDVTGDSFEVNYYNRLSPLVVDNSHVGFGKLTKGDCVVAFSRKDVLTLKSAIEKTYRKKCSVVYGALPPEARVQQTHAFNDTDSDVDVMIATDAIGMGLNLNIKRVIFSTLDKFDGKLKRQLHHGELKQIAGRAGRFASAYDKGLVTSINAKDLPIIQKLLERPNLANERAGIFPQAEQLEIFASLHQDIRFSELITMFIEYTELEHLYFLEDVEDKIKMAQLIDHLEMSVSDRYIFILAPIKNNIASEKSFVEFATQFSKGRMVRLNESMPRRRQDWEPKEQELQNLESIYAISDVYLWLAQRFKGRFPDLERAQDLCLEINNTIPEILSEPLPKRDRKHHKSKRYNSEADFFRIRKEMGM